MIEQHCCAVRLLLSATPALPPHLPGQERLQSSAHWYTSGAQQRCVVRVLCF
jgi:hypothetical protein